MHKVLILCAHRPGRSPSQRYRFEQYLPFLEKNGFTFTWSYLLDEKDDHGFYAHGNLFAKFWILTKGKVKRLNDVLRFRNFDVIFIQREAYFLGTSFFEKRAFRSGAYVIFDFDDSIWIADTSPANLKWEKLKRPKKFFVNIRNAHCVIAGNRYLALKAKSYNKNTVLIPTTIDTDFHKPRLELRNSGKVTIGWSGSLSTLKHFETLVPILQTLKQKYGELICFRLLGVKNYSSSLQDLTSVGWSAAREVDELNKFDIGIMPLPDDEWSLGKCGLKALSYMACEVPSVASAVGANMDFIIHGQNGFLSSNSEEWISYLSRLIEDRELREKIGAAGRVTVETNYSVNAHKHKYLEVFSRNYKAPEL
jgi:glycosyltransferase involved in cell wall biosynthesis